MSKLSADEAALMQYMVPGSTVDDLVSDEEDDEFDYGGYYDVKHAKGGGGQGTAVVVDGTGTNHANTQQEATSLAKFQPAQHKNASSSVLRRIHIDDYFVGDGGGGGGGASGATKMNQRVLNELRDATMNQRFASGTGSKNVDRSERATVENVLDPRTRLILYKMVNSGFLKEINGCVSTGKEANVYFAVGADGSPFALKVYKTSILVFRDRDQYVSGEYRFQRYCKSNPRKMVRTWAEKEARNLIRLQEGGVLAPAVKLLRQHVLVMEFLGEDGWPAPRLKEVDFGSQAILDMCYLDLCCTMRKMYGRCRLIHGDLSEYNLLLYRNRVVVIDVSQSVEHDHPRAMDFLRRDIVNVNTFFRSKGHRSLFRLQDLYGFITAPAEVSGWKRCQGPDNTEELMQRLAEVRAQYTNEGLTPLDAEQAKVDEQVFLNIFVPRSLNEIADHRAPNADIALFVEGMVAGGHANAGDGGDDADDSSNEQTEEADDEESEGEDGEEDEGEGKKKEKKSRKGQVVDPALHRPIAEMSKDERKEHRKAVKEAQRQRRVEKKQNGEKKKKKKK